MVICSNGRRRKKGGAEVSRGIWMGIYLPGGQVSSGDLCADVGVFVGKMT